MIFKSVFQRGVSCRRSGFSGFFAALVILSSALLVGILTSCEIEANVSASENYSIVFNSNAGFEKYVWAVEDAEIPENSSAISDSGNEFTLDASLYGIGYKTVELRVTPSDGGYYTATATVLISE